MVILPVLFFLLKIALAIWGPLWFYINFDYDQIKSVSLFVVE